jgi:two-component system, OmpR family, response regulator QseB
VYRQASTSDQPISSAEESCVKLLLVEDDPHIARLVLRALEAHGYQTRHVTTLNAARDALISEEPDGLLLDVQLPDSDEGGFLLAREARAAGFQGSILFMTARDAVSDRIAALDHGGDDYIIKPFDLSELLARVRAVLRRGTQITSNQVQHGQLEVNFKARTVSWAGILTSLSRREFALLERFVLEPERVFGSEEILDLVWSSDGTEPGVVRVFVHHLRSKLGPDVIETVPVWGYRLGACQNVERT